MRLSAPARFQLSLLGGLILAHALLQTAEAIKPFGATDAEVLMLPPYCQAILQPDKFPQHQRLAKSVAGPGMNHYCYALYFIDRAKQERLGSTDRNHYLNEAADNLRYVMARNDDKHVLAPDFHINLGNVLLMQDRTADAASHFVKATAIRPDYPKGWLALSDLFKGMGQLDQARDALEKGLAASPKKYKDYMKKRLDELTAEIEAAQQAKVPEKAEGK